MLSKSLRIEHSLLEKGGQEFCLIGENERVCITVRSNRTPKNACFVVRGAGSSYFQAVFLLASSYHIQISHIADCYEPNFTQIDVLMLSCWMSFGNRSHSAWRRNYEHANHLGWVPTWRHTAWNCVFSWKPYWASSTMRYKLAIQNHYRQDMGQHGAKPENLLGTIELVGH